MEVEHALDMAEQERRCVVMPAHSLRCALLRRVGAGDVMSPARGLFVRREYWERLGAFERNRHMTRALNLQYPAWVFGGLEAACAHRIDHDISLHGNALKVIVTKRRTQSSYGSSANTARNALRSWWTVCACRRSPAQWPRSCATMVSSMRSLRRAVPCAGK